MPKVPAFGWPPRFLNQMAQFFAFVTAGGLAVIKSPGIVSVTKTGTGVYSVIINKADPQLLPLVFVPLGLYSATVVNPTEYQVETFDAAAAAADRDFMLILSAVPASWVQV